jgi:hypothetical protein
MVYYFLQFTAGGYAKVVLDSRLRGNDGMIEGVMTE